MKFIGYTFTYNESALVPYVMPYFERMGLDRLIVFDNYSTDNTVELLSKYSFVEIRMRDTNGIFDEAGRRDMHLDIFEESKRMTKDGEWVWMAYLDFDEVIYCSAEASFRDFLEWQVYGGYNCFDGRMLQLSYMGNQSTALEYVNNGNLIHTLNGVRGSWWTKEGRKPTLIFVNDIKHIWTSGGNHYMIVEPEEGKPIVNLANNGDLHAFHLKFIDFEALKAKKLGYGSERKDVNEYKFKYLDDSYYNSIVGSSFPLDIYFALSCLSSQKEIIKQGMWYGEGIYDNKDFGLK